VKTPYLTAVAVRPFNAPSLDPARAYLDGDGSSSERKFALWFEGRRWNNGSPFWGRQTIRLPPCITAAQPLVRMVLCRSGQSQAIEAVSLSTNRQYGSDGRWLVTPAHTQNAYRPLRLGQRQTKTSARTVDGGDHRTHHSSRYDTNGSLWI